MQHQADALPHIFLLLSSNFDLTVAVNLLIFSDADNKENPFEFPTSQSFFFLPFACYSSSSCRRWQHCSWKEFQNFKMLEQLLVTLGSHIKQRSSAITGHKTLTARMPSFWEMDSNTTSIPITNLIITILFFRYYQFFGDYGSRRYLVNKSGPGREPRPPCAV
jgi:hypothetical protein